MSASTFPNSPLGQRTFGPFNFRTGDTNLALGDSAFAPLVLGWNAGNFHWNVGVFGFAPTGDYSKKQLANTSLNHWAVMNRIAGTYYNPKTGWQVNGAVGPIVSYTIGDPANGLTFIGKYYQEFDAQNTFEGNTFDFAFTAKF